MVPRGPVTETNSVNDRISLRKIGMAKSVRSRVIGEIIRCYNVIVGRVRTPNKTMHTTDNKELEINHRRMV